MDLIKFVSRPLNKLVNFFLRMFEEVVLYNFVSDGFKYVPLFIIGAPRSGSTLLFQMLVNRFKFGYMTNLHCAFYGSPAIVQFVLNLLGIEPPPSPYTSNRGYTPGLLSPSECGNDWYKWFRKKPEYISYDEIDIDYLKAKMRKSLILLERTFNKPLLFKNLHNSVRLIPLGLAVPEAKFIVVKRKVIWNAQSLLLVRKKTFGSKSHWFSVEPKGVEELLKLEPESQVVLQIKKIYEHINDAVKILGAGRFITVYYENFRIEPESTLLEIKNFAGCDLEDKETIIPAFKKNDEQKLPDDEFMKIKKQVVSIYGDIDSYP